MVSTVHASSCVRELLGTVGCKAVLHNCRVLLIFHGLLQVLHVHVPEVVVLSIDCIFAVGRNICPSWVILLLFLFSYICEFPLCNVPFETEYLVLLLWFARSFLLTFLLFLRNHEGGPYLKCKGFVLICKFKPLEREVLGIKRVFGNGRNLSRQFAHIPYFPFGTCCRIYNVVFCAVCSFISVPELV